jgi:hypothetical protein
VATESDEPVQHRKPLRRTAWSLLIGGAVAFCLVIGTNLLLLAGGQDVGPGQPGVVPAREQVTVHRRPGSGDNKANNAGCEVIGPDGKRTYYWLTWGESVNWPTKATLNCEREAVLLTGTASTVGRALQGPLFALPLAAMIAGLLAFFPRFTLALARMSNGRFLRR